MDGAFPNYKQVLPEESKKPVFAGRAALAECMKRVLLMTADNAAGVMLSLGDGKLTVAARNADMGEAVDSLPVEYTGAPLEISLNGRYVQDMLAAVDGEKVVLSMTGEMDPVSMRPAGSDNHRYILMPMRR